MDFVFAGVASSFIWRISSSVTVAKRAAILKISSGGEYPGIYRVWWTNQNARKVLSTCLANTNTGYPASDEPIRARIEWYSPRWQILIRYIWTIWPWFGSLPIKRIRGQVHYGTKRGYVIFQLSNRLCKFIEAEFGKDQDDGEHCHIGFIFYSRNSLCVSPSGGFVSLCH